MNLNGKKLFLIGFIVVLLIGIPLTVYLLQQQQNVSSHAQASSNLSFSPDSTSAAPIQKNVGDTVPLDVSLDPGKNLVGFVKLVIQYDPSVLATASANAFSVNPNALPAVLEGPIYSSGQIAVTLSAGADPTKVIQAKTTLATITFKALKNTPPGTPTLVTYTTNTQVMSSGPNDQAAENVLSSATPATIAIGGAAPSESIPPSPTPSGVVATPTVAAAPTPTTVPVSGAPTATPTIAPSTTPATSGTPTNNVPPVCSSLTADRSTTGNAPFSLTFSANGNDTDGTISKVTFNFGDGQVSDVTQAGGIGTASVNVQASHTFNNPGTYQATAVLTDNNGGVSTSSSSSSCSQTITVNAASGSATTSGGSTNPTPTMPPTGSTGLTIGIGLGAALLIIGGGLLFFIL